MSPSIAHPVSPSSASKKQKAASTPAVNAQNAAMLVAAGAAGHAITRSSTKPKTPRAAAASAKIASAMAGNDPAAQKSGSSARRRQGTDPTPAAKTGGAKPVGGSRKKKAPTKTGQKPAKKATNTNVKAPPTGRDERIETFQYSGPEVDMVAAVDKPDAAKAPKDKEKRPRFSQVALGKAYNALQDQSDMNIGLNQNTQTQLDMVDTKVTTMEKILGQVRGEVTKLAEEKVAVTHLGSFIADSVSGAVTKVVDGINDTMTNNLKKVYETMDEKADTIKKETADSAKAAAASAKKAEAAREKARLAATAVDLDTKDCKLHAANASTDATAAKEAKSSAQTFATNAEEAATVATDAKGKAEEAATTATEAKDEAKKHADEAKKHADEAKKHAETGKENWDRAAGQLLATQKVHETVIDIHSKTVNAEATILKLEQNKSFVDVLASCKPIADALQDIGDPKQVADNLRLVNEYKHCFQQLKELGSPEAVSGMIETIKGTDLSQLSETVKLLSAGPEACRRKRSADEMHEKQALNAQLGQACQAMVSMNETMGRFVGKLEDCVEQMNKRQRTMRDEHNNFYG